MLLQFLANVINIINFILRLVVKIGEKTTAAE